MAAYNEQYQKYLESLPEEERMALGGAIAKKEESPPGSPDKKGSSKAQVCLTHTGGHCWTLCVQWMCFNKVYH